MAKSAPVSARPAALLSEADAAHYLGIGKTNLRSLGLRRKKLGARRLYPLSDLDEFVESLPYENNEEEDAETGWEDVA